MGRIQQQLPLRLLLHVNFEKTVFQFLSPHKESLNVLYVVMKCTLHIEWIDIKLKKWCSIPLMLLRPQYIYKQMHLDLFAHNSTATFEGFWLRGLQCLI